MFFSLSINNNTRYFDIVNQVLFFYSGLWSPQQSSLFVSLAYEGTFLRFPFLQSTFHHNKKNHIIGGVWRFKRIQATARHTVLLQSSQNSFAPLFFFRKEKGGEPQTIHMTTTHELPFSLILPLCQTHWQRGFHSDQRYIKEPCFLKCTYSLLRKYGYFKWRGVLGGKTKTGLFLYFSLGFFFLPLGCRSKRQKNPTLTGLSHK